MMKWQVYREDFDDGIMRKMLAGSHPHFIHVAFNIFTKEIWFEVTNGMPAIRRFETFDEALADFNSQVE